MVFMQGRNKGLFLVAISALLFSTPGLFTRAVEAGAWEVTFWRAVFGIAFMLSYLAWRGRLRADIAGLGFVGLAVSAIWASGAIAYIQAYKLTTIANVSLLYGSAPLLSALLAWIFLKEKLRQTVLVASGLAFLGVAVVAYGSLGKNNFIGDLLALWMTLTAAASFVIFRAYPATPAASTTLFASLLVLPPCLIWGDPFTVAAHEILVLAAFGLVFVCAATTLTEGSKFLPAGETALVSNLEVPLQPILAFLIFAELPPMATFAGGALIAVAVLASQWRGRA